MTRQLNNTEVSVRQMDVSELDMPFHPLHRTQVVNRTKLEEVLVNDPRLFDYMAEYGFPRHQDHLHDFLDKVIVEESKKVLFVTTWIPLDDLPKSNT